MATRRIWAIGCGLVMVITLARGWVLGASPLLASARAAGETRDAAEAQNQAYSQELDLLKEQFKGIDQLQDQLDELRGEVPSAAQLPDYLAQLSTEAQRHSVTLTAITTADAVAYAPTAAEAPADAETPAADAAAEPVPAPAAAGAGTPVTSPLVTAENFIAIPLTVGFTGGYDNVLAFVESLQKGTRLTAVTTFSTAKKDAGAGDDEAPLVGDAVTGTMSLFIYVLLDPTAAG